MVVVALSIDGSGKLPVQLQPDIIYRIGRRSGLEFSSNDQSMELAHATIALIPGGIVRLAAVAGKIFVNDRETQITSISESDVSSGFIDLRFGKVKAKLSFEDTNNEVAHDSSGYDDNIKEKSSDVTPDSINIPETAPPSNSNTFEEESFNIPETQAVSFTRSFRRDGEPKVSLGDDFLIPETQEVLIRDNNPVMVQEEEPDEKEEVDDVSEMGTQIRICTQEYNEFPGDAIDDFDSSLLLDDGAFAIPTVEQTSAAAYDLEMSALNWSVSNSKCTAVNSTKTDVITSRSEICVTPELSVVSKNLEDVTCTPDLMDLLESISNKDNGDCTPELINEATPIEADVVTQQLCIAKQLAVVNIETPEPSQTKPESDAQDFIETQAFPLQSANVSGLNPVESNDIMQDFIETQTSPMRSANVSLDKPVESNENSQDFIETQAFERSKNLQSSSPKVNGNVELTETEALSEGNSFVVPPLQPQLNKSIDQSQDFVATQAFIRPSCTPVSKTNESVNTSFVTTACIHHNTTEDMMETQLFVQPVKASKKNAGLESEKDRLDITDSLNIGDEFDHELEEFIALGATSNTPSDDEQHRLTQPAGVGEKTTSGKQILNDDKNNGKEQHQQPNPANDITPKELPTICQTLNSTSRPISYLHFSALPNAQSCTSSPFPDQNLESLSKEINKRSVQTIQCKKVCGDNLASKEKEIMAEVPDSANSSPEFLIKNKDSVSLVQDETKKTSELPKRKRNKTESEPNQLLLTKKTRIQKTSEPPQPTTSAMSSRTRRKRSIAGLDAEQPIPTKKNRSKLTVNIETNSVTAEQLIKEDFSYFKTVQLKVLVKDEKIGKQLISTPIQQRDQMEEDTKASSNNKERKVQNVRNTNDDNKPEEKVTRSRKEMQNEAMKTKEKKKEDTPISIKDTKVLREDSKPKEKGTRSRKKLPNEEIKTKEKEKEDMPISIRKTQRRATNTGSEEVASATKGVKSVASRKVANKKEIEEKYSTDDSDREPVKERKARKTNSAKTTKETSKDSEKDAQTTKRTRTKPARGKKGPSESPSKDINDSSSKSSHQPNELKATTSQQTRNVSKKLEKATKKTAEETTTTTNSREKNARRGKVASEDINGHSNKPAFETDDNKATTSQISRRSNTRQKQQSSEDEIKDEAKLSGHDQLKDINDYIKNIKRSSRKIQLTLSMCNNVELQPVLKALKNIVIVAEDPLHCDLLIMDKGERTYKFLMGVAANKPILSSRWLYFMKDTRCSIVRADHIFKDEKFEKMFKYNPLSALEYPDLLKEFHFMLGNEIQPSAVNMKAIIESAGGIVHSEAPLIARNTRLYVVISNGNKHKWPLLKHFTNVQYIKTEGVMQALVQHKTELLDEPKLKL